MGRKNIWNLAKTFKTHIYKKLNQHEENFNKVYYKIASVSKKILQVDREKKDTLDIEGRHRDERRLLVGNKERQKTVEVHLKTLKDRI